MTAAPELTTVADDTAIVFSGGSSRVYDALRPETDYDLDGIAFRTLPTPPGERLAVVATVNDLHFGETECGVLEGLFEAGPVLRSEPGEPPYPEVMNEAAVAEILAVEPDAVVAKGDLTDDGRDDEYAAFLACYGRLGDRLHHVRGNHDRHRGQSFADDAPFAVDLPGATLAVLDTTVPFLATGRLPTEQLEWLDDLAAHADRPVLVFGHHHPWSPDSRSRPEGYFGIEPSDSERLVELVARRASIVGYFAGHTHRNRVRLFSATGAVPWVEVACVKDFPGAWAEYRIHEGGMLQVVHRIRQPRAVAWTERTRQLFGGLYPRYSFGDLGDRCFSVPVRVR